MDRRLSAIISQAFEDCNSLNSIFKLIIILSSLLERPAIKKDFEPRFAQILQMLENEIDDTKKIYDVQKHLKDTKNQIDVHRNLPEVSGAMKWCHELRERVTKPMEQFKKLIEHPIIESEQMERVNKKYQEILDLLDAFATEVYKDWCLHVGTLSNDNLEKNLINRDSESKNIDTNFDPQVNYLLLFKLICF